MFQQQQQQSATLKDSLHYIDETAYDIWKRFQYVPLKTGLEFIDQVYGIEDRRRQGIGSGQVVDVCGDVDTSKTECLYHILIHCIWNEKVGVVYFDHDMKFDIERIRQLLRKRIRKTLDTSKEEEEEEEALGRIGLFRSRNTYEFLQDLKRIRHLFVSGEARVLMIDSLSAFRWDDLANKSYASTQGQRLLRWFQHFLRDTSAVVFGVRNIVTNGSSSTSSSSSSDTYPKYWQLIATSRLYLRRATSGKDDRCEEQGTKTTNECRHSNFEAGWARCIVEPTFVAKFSVGPDGIRTKSMSA